MRGLAGLLLGLVLAVGSGPAARAASPFADWTAAVIAGDFRAHSGEPSEVFDNARRDVAAQLPRLGFTPANIVQFSVRPERYRDAAPRLSALRVIREELASAAAKAKAGCLVYYTSHGIPGGLILATEREELISPAQLNAAIAAACPNRPVVVVLSACFSGSFIPGLAADDRMIITAARRDRSSFGCGESDTYPYFDACFLERAPTARDFVDLADRVRACVAAKERETGARPPSEPQVWIGPALKPLLPLYGFPSG